MSNWHMDVKTIVTLAVISIANTGTVIWGAAEVTTKVSSLESLPKDVQEIRDRVIALEAREAQRDEVLGELKEAIKGMTIVMNKFGYEQSRRTPMINHVEHGMNGKRHK